MTCDLIDFAGGSGRIVGFWGDTLPREATCSWAFRTVTWQKSGSHGKSLCQKYGTIWHNMAQFFFVDGFCMLSSFSPFFFVTFCGLKLDFELIQEVYLTEFFCVDSRCQHVVPGAWKNHLVMVLCFKLTKSRHLYTRGLHGSDHLPLVCEFLDGNTRGWGSKLKTKMLMESLFPHETSFFMAPKKTLQHSAPWPSC